MARSRSEPALRYLRWGAYFGLGLGLAGLSLRSLRGTGPEGSEADGSRPGGGQFGALPAFAARMVEQGESAIGGLRSRPGVSRVTTEASRVKEDLASRVELATDEAHDSLEEVYGRSYAWLGGLRRKVYPARSRD